MFFVVFVIFVFSFFRAEHGYTTGMTLLGDMSPAARKSVLAVSMLVVLLLITGAAWLLSRTAGGPRPGEQWYLLEEGNVPIGWRVVARTEDKDGPHGYDVIGRPRTEGRETLMHWSRWRLNARAKQGVYFSFIPLGQGPEGQIVYQQTDIKYGAGRVIITQTTPTPVGPRGLQRVVDVDAKYLPEGTLWPAIAEAAKKGEKAAHKMVQDDVMDLINVAMEPLEKQSLMVQGASVSVTPVKVSLADDRGNALGEALYFVADDGAIVRIQLAAEGLSQIYDRVDYAAITQRFPRAPSDRTRALRQQDLP